MQMLPPQVTLHWKGLTPGRPYHYQALPTQQNGKWIHGCRDRNLTKMLTGVVINTHCLTKFSREAGLTLYLGPAHYIYVCYLKSQISSSSPPSDCNLESVWSCQVDLQRDVPIYMRRTNTPVGVSHLPTRET